MAVTAHTLLDLAKLRYDDPAVGLIEENLSYAPELKTFAARTIPGILYKTAVRTAFPTVGFTAVNAGIAVSKSALDQRLVECFLMRASMTVDLALVNQSGDTLMNLETLEASGVMKAAMLWVGKQIWQGAGNDAKGFGGLKAAVASTSAMALDATGNTGSTQSSVYGVKFGDQNVSLIFGANTTFNLSAFRDQQVLDSNSLAFDARVAGLTSWVGLQVGNANCVGRIFNLTVAVPLTDLLLSKLLAKYPVGYKPDAWFVSRRSAQQLQASRTVTLFGSSNGGPSAGLGTIADLPEFAFGIPIVITDSIPETDAHE